MTAAASQPKAGAATWYRSDQERHKSVSRRANPLHRRFGRGLIGLVAVCALAAGLYFGARALQDYLGRDRLPAQGAETPTIRATSFQIQSASPAPDVDGTLTIDANTSAFEFIGRNGGPQSDMQVVSADGTTVYIRTANGDWRLADDSDTIDDDVRAVVAYVSNDATPDAILTNRLRRGYVELVTESTEGAGDDELTRYDIELNTLAFSTDYPLQWGDFQSDAVPGVATVRVVPMSIWLDSDGVLVRVTAERSGWSWERLTYSDLPFTPGDPGATLPTDPPADG